MTSARFHDGDVGWVGVDGDLGRQEVVSMEKGDRRRVEADNMH